MSTIDNPEIDRLIGRGDFAIALRQPIRRTEAQGRALESMMLGPKLSEGAAEDLAYAGITLGDFLYDYIRIDPLVVEGIDFARSDDLHNLLSFAHFAEQHRELTGSALAGSISNLQGYVAERAVAQHLEAAGHDVSFPDLSNQEGYDVLVDGHPFQVKCLLDADGVHEHLGRFDYPVIVNSELADQVGHLNNVYVDAALHHDAIVDATKDTLHHGAELTDFEIPWISLAVSSMSPGYRLFRRETDLPGFATAVATNTAGRALFSLAGSKGAALAGLALFGPAGAVFGGVVGAILGAGVGRRVAAAARGVFTVGEAEKLKRARTELIECAIEASRPKRTAWDEKRQQLESALGGPAAGCKELHRFVSRVHRAEMCYMQARVSDLEHLVADGDELDACDAALQSLVMVKRAGIHQHFVQGEIQRLLRALEGLMEARKRWLVS
jgi:hypothetical protein